LGNAPYDEGILQSLITRLPEASPMVKEHIEWAISQQSQRIP